MILLPSNFQNMFKCNNYLIQIMILIIVILFLFIIFHLDHFYSKSTHIFLLFLPIIRIPNDLMLKPILFSLHLFLLLQFYLLDVIKKIPHKLHMLYFNNIQYPLLYQYYDQKCIKAIHSQP